ncbi:MAG TPA: hypothetical protein VFG51_03300, partial [Candidatus Saccharimonadia bacterium]|nr:hypothetical protein [Candidatus Saccharimonadia bacterium]
MRKAVFLFVVACIVYLPTFANQFVWDDEQFITKNVLVQHISNWPMYFTTNTIAGAGLNSNYYRPLTTLSFAIDTAIWGKHTFGFHLTNLLLHAIGGVLVYVLLKKLLSLHSSSPTYDLLAYVTAFAFVLHPAQVEAVAYINSRGDSLSLVYGSLMILALMAIQKTSSDNKRILLGFASVVSFWIALLTKESAIAWAGVATLCVGLLLAKLVKVRPGVYFTAALHVISALGYLVLRFTVLQFQSTNDVWGPSSVYAHSLSTRLMTFFFVAIPQYLSILIWPLGLHMEREMKLVF